MASLSHEALVELERGIEQFLSKSANINGILDFEKCVFTDARQVFVDSLEGHIEVVFGLLADIGFAAEFGVQFGVFGRQLADWPASARPELPPDLRAPAALPHPGQ